MSLRGRPVVQIQLQAGEREFLERLSRKRNAPASEAKQLRTLQTRIDEYRRRSAALFASHPDSGLFGSLPGAGPKLAPRLLSEIGSDRALYDDAQGLQCVAGTACP